MPQTQLQAPGGVREGLAPGCRPRDRHIGTANATKPLSDGVSRRWRYQSDDVFSSPAGWAPRRDAQCGSQGRQARRRPDPQDRHSGV